MDEADIGGGGGVVGADDSVQSRFAASLHSKDENL